MLPRHLAPRLLRDASQYPVITLTGPRQSGKTTLVRSLFEDTRYVSLETPSERRHALEDPVGFLARFPDAVIIDEAQRAPELFSYIQTIVDEEDRSGRFILTGSQNFLLLEGVTQSLAGRAAITHLLPFNLREIHRVAVPEALDDGLEPFEPERRPHGQKPASSLMGALIAGFYPRIHDKGLEPYGWLDNYVQTYLERDVRQLEHVGDLASFERFLRLVAGRSGQLLNLSALASDTGVSQPTATRWLSILEASFLVKRVQPYHKSYRKRLVKAPKLYFLDSGLLCYLLDIRTPDELFIHPARGAIFEGFVLAEIVKRAYNRGERPRLYHWRDSAGHEVDFILERGQRRAVIEVKSSATLHGDHVRGLHWWRDLAQDDQASLVLVTGGEEEMDYKGVHVLPWWRL
jgi:uncharacterized protein